MNEISDTQKPNATFGTRHVQVLLIFLGNIFINLMKVDMSLGIVAMTDISKNNTFDWSLQTQSVIFSSYKWGFLASNIPGGVLAARFGGKIVLIVCGAVNCAGSLLLPTSAVYGGWKAVCGVRLLQGLALGLLIPTIKTLQGKWLPSQERASLVSVMTSGTQLGLATEYMLAGIVANYWSWHAIFYVNGILLSIWTLIYILFGSASPSDSKQISSEERAYIQSSLKQINGQRVQTPWKAILTSAPFLTQVAVHTCFIWCYGILLTQSPTYLNKVYGIDIKMNGFLSALPYLGCFVTCYVFGPIADYTIKKSWIDVTASRKLNSCTGFLIQALIFSTLTFVADDITTAVALLTVCKAVDSLHTAGFSLCYLDMSPNHAGIMSGIASFIANVLTSFSPLAVGWMIKDPTSPTEWQKVFLLAAVLVTVSNLLFFFFGTSKLQKWNDLSEENPDSSATETNKKSKVKV